MSNSLKLLTDYSLLSSGCKICLKIKFFLSQLHFFPILTLRVSKKKNEKNGSSMILFLIFITKFCLVVLLTHCSSYHIYQTDLLIMRFVKPGRIKSIKPTWDENKNKQRARGREEGKREEVPRIDRHSLKCLNSWLDDCCLSLQTHPTHWHNLRSVILCIQWQSYSLKVFFGNYWKSCHNLMKFFFKQRDIESDLQSDHFDLISLHFHQIRIEKASLKLM